MADIKLGPEGAEVTLPQISWRGEAPELPIEYDVGVEKARMADGSHKYNFLKQKRTWSYEWDRLVESDKNIIKTQAEKRQILRLQDNWESTDWHNVVVIGFGIQKLVSSYATDTKRYKVSLTLEEA